MSVNLSVARMRPARKRLVLLFAWVVAVLPLGLAVGGCAIKLAPDYDKTIIDGLTKSNEDAMTLFASVSKGTIKGTFAKQRKDLYDKLIGKLDALRVQALARPTPRPLFAQVLAIGPRPDTQPADIDKLLVAPTPDLLAALIKILTAMRDADSGFGLRQRDVIRFKGEFEISMDQALTYEKALER
jgi:hypothetical protein